MRSARCKNCGGLFMTLTNATECGECTGTAGSISGADDEGLIQLASAQPEKGPQTVDLKSLTGLEKDQGVTDVGPVKKTRKKSTP